MSSNLLADNAPAPIQEPVAVTVNPVQEPVTDVQADAVQEQPVQASEFTSNSCESLPSLIHLDTPSHRGKHLRRERENVLESGL